LARKIGELFLRVRPETAGFAREANKPVESAGHKAGKVFGQAFERAFAAASIAIGAALAGGVLSGLATSKTDALLASQLGLDPTQAKAIGKVSGRLMARGVIEGAEEANAAIRTAIQSGIASAADGPELDRVAARVANLAKVMEIDASRVGAAVSTMLKTGIAKSAEEAFDLIQRGTELGIDKSQDLLDTFIEYPTLFRGLGLSGQQAMGLLNQGLQAGARNSDIVADALKEFQLRAIDGSKLTAQGFKDLGLNAKKMADDIGAGGPRAAAALDLTLDRLRAIEDPVKRNAAAVALFGTKAEDMAEALFALDVTGAAESLGEVEGAAKRAGDALEQSAGAKVSGFVVAVKTRLVDAIASAVGWMERNQTATKTLGIALASVAAIMVTVGAAMKVYAGVQAVIRVATIAWTAVNYVLGTSMWAALGPIGLIVLAVAALVAGVIYAYKHSERFRNIVQAVWRGIQVAVGAVVGWFQTYVWPTLKVVWDGIVWVVRNAVEGFKIYMAIARAVVTTLVDFFMRWVWPGIKLAWDLIVGAVRNAVEGFKFYFALAQAIVRNAIANIRTAIDRIREISAIFRNAFEAARAAVVDRVNAVIAFVRGIGGQVRSAVGDLGSILIGAGRQIIDGLLNGISAGFDRVRSKLRELTDLLPDWKGPVAKDRQILFGAGASIIDGLGRGMASRVRGIRDQLGSLTTTVAGSATPRGSGGEGLATASQLERLIRAVERVAPGVGRELNGSMSTAIQLGRAG